METNLLLQKNAIIILRKMITIKKRHFRSKQDFHLESSPIGNLKSFMSGPPVAKETVVLLSTIHRRLAQLRLIISTIHRRLAQLRLTISTIHRRSAHKELNKFLVTATCHVESIEDDRLRSRPRVSNADNLTHLNKFLGTTTCHIESIEDERT